MTVTTIERLKHLRVLLIDDDKWIRNSLKYYFQKKTLMFKALENTESNRINFNDFDIVICDYKLPGADGIDFLNAAATSKPEIIRILITAYATKEVMSKAAHAGVDDFIAKPFTARDIENSLEKLI